VCVIGAGFLLGHRCFLIMSLRLVDPCGWLKGRPGKPELIATIDSNC
jgi:hypothetical protein